MFHTSLIILMISHLMYSLHILDMHILLSLL